MVFLLIYYLIDDIIKKTQFKQLNMYEKVTKDNNDETDKKDREKMDKEKNL